MSVGVAKLLLASRRMRPFGVCTTIITVSVETTKDLVHSEVSSSFATPPDNVNIWSANTNFVTGITGIDFDFGSEVVDGLGVILGTLYAKRTARPTLYPSRVRKGQI